MASQPVLILIRGLSGSGKSTLAQTLCKIFPNLRHFENDMYRKVGPDGQYQYSFDDYNEVRRRSLADVTHCLSQGDSVVVSNVMTSAKTMEMYTNLPYRHVILRTTGEYEPVEDVPLADRERMRNMFEDVPGEIVLGNMDDVSIADIRKLIYPED